MCPSKSNTQSTLKPSSFAGVAVDTDDDDDDDNDDDEAMPEVIDELLPAASVVVEEAFNFQRRAVPSCDAVARTRTEAVLSDGSVGWGA